jgi:thiol-disulfide isomerase/thioredoxin
MKILSLVCFALTFCLLAAGAEPKPTKAAEALSAIQKDWRKAQADYERVFDEAKTAEARKLLASKTPNISEFALRYLKLADAYPGTKEELIALCWAALNDAGFEAGKKATARLIGGRIDRATPDELVKALESARILRSVDQRSLVPAVLARAKKSLDDSHTARLLAWVCCAYMDNDSDKAPEPFTVAADLIVAKFADSPGISNFCEALFQNGGPPWAAEFEKHLRTIAEKNKTPLVRITSRYALASIVRSKGVDSQGNAEEMFRQFIADFDNKPDDGASSGLRSQYVDQARRELKEIRLCGLGKQARTIDGKDLDGNPLKLSDHKGKVVLLVFWASWCKSCMTDVSHEKELVERFKDHPFVLIGVNGDEKADDAKQAIAKEGIPWRSFVDGKGGDGPIAKAWVVAGWPTVYVIDHTGIIRESRLRGKRLDAPLERLIKEAEKPTPPGKH